MSKKAFKVARHSIYNFVKYNVRGKSFSTVSSIRERMISSMKYLHSLGYPVRNINNIQKKHIDALVKSWQSRELSIGTIKNRMADFRTFAKATGKDYLIKQNNKDYDIPNRSYVPTENRAITEIDLSQFKDENLKASIWLQKEFGLRREECLKIIPSKALYTDLDGKKSLILDSLWTKGGVGRKITIRNESQFHSIENAKVVAEGKSLIPHDKSYIQQRRFYDKVTREQGYYNLHGLRHAYAQTRYKEITGWECPLKGGLAKKDFTDSQKKLDYNARLCISQELGHSRSAITKNYIG